MSYFLPRITMMILFYIILILVVVVATCCGLFKIIFCLFFFFSRENWMRINLFTLFYQRIRKILWLTRNKDRYNF